MKRPQAHRWLRGSTRPIISLLAIAALLVAASAPGSAGPPDGKQCAPLDGKYEVGGGWTGTQVAGIDVVSASDEQVTFTIAEGLTLMDLCVKTGSELNQYLGDVSLPAIGPQSITLSKLGPGFGIGYLTFDAEPTVPEHVVCPEVAAPQVEFGDVQYIDTTRAGGEPVTQVAQDGSISVSAHAGTTHVYKAPTAAPGAGDFAMGYFNQTLTWRSEDGGESWDYVGLTELDDGMDVGPHSVASTGFSDPDYAMDAAGTIYNTEIDLANVAVFSSRDDGQSYTTAHPYAWAGDRPWLTALEANEVFLYVNQPKRMLQSEDGGVTWVPYVAAPAVSSKSVPDPLNPTDAMIGPVGLGRFAIGTENEAATPQTISWETKNFGRLGISRQFFGVVAVDNAGNVYQAAAGGYNGLNTLSPLSAPDTNPNGQVTFTYFERATERTNGNTLIEIDTPAGDSLWPWVIAGDDGRAAVVWYQSLAGAPNDFYIFAAVTNNAHGTDVTCSDGSTKRIQPQFTVVNASERPIHHGMICVDGTTCNAAANVDGGDRRLGDFFSVNFDHEGNLLIASADTMLTNPLGGPKPVGNPIFIKQVSGDRMLEEAMAIRETRPRCNVLSPPAGCS